MRTPAPIREVPVPCGWPEAWSGWRFAGRELIAPDGQRIGQRRLLGLLWREQMELLRAGYNTRRQAEAGKRAAARAQLVKVVVVQLADVRVGGSAAG